MNLPEQLNDLMFSEPCARKREILCAAAKELRRLYRMEQGSIGWGAASGSHVEHQEVKP